jgi:DNA-binding NarL/FixJ family response regulator
LFITTGLNILLTLKLRRLHDPKNDLYQKIATGSVARRLVKQALDILTLIFLLICGMNEKSINQALRKYKTLKIREIKAREERKIVKEFLIAAGIDLDGSKRRAERNEKIFKLFQDGATNKDIAQLVDLSVKRIQQYRNRFEKQRQR